MDIKVKPGKYVAAVSGGVDSVVLLDLLAAKAADCQFVVAHFDHGIRNGSETDRKFVADLAKRYGLPFEYAEGHLGRAASEATARQARYEFLEKVRRKHRATAIITAHHQDDVLETAIINLLRGTGRKGLSSLGDRPGVVRPLLKVSKSQILAYARENTLEWREDITNTQEAYLRNYVRRQLLPRFSGQAKAKLLSIINRSRDSNQAIDGMLQQELQSKLAGGRLDRAWFIQLPHSVALEVMAAWLRFQGTQSFDSKGLERLVVGAKTGQPGSCFDVSQGLSLQVNKDTLALM